MAITADLLFCAHGRREFTRASLKALLANTPADKLGSFSVMTDGDHMPLEGVVPFHYDDYRYGGPVACLTHFVKHTHSEFIAKIDNDLIVCPGWLEACLDVMRRYPSVGALGLEAWSKDANLFPSWIEPTLNSKELSIRPVPHVGGIGLFRRSIFDKGLPTPNGRYGWTEFQWQSLFIKAFLQPPLPVFLLDHINREPWMSLSRKYEAAGVQRASWGMYPESCAALWRWWTK